MSARSRRGRPRTEPGTYGAISGVRKLKSGKMQVSATLRLPSGATRRVTGAGQSHTDARQSLDANAARMLETWNAVVMSPTMTVRELGAHWLAQFRKSDRAPQTIQRYEATLRGAVDRELGSLTLQELSNGRIRQLVRELAEEHLAEARSFRVVVRAVLAHGAEYDVCSPTLFNFDGVELPVPRRVPRAITGQELVELRELIDADRRVARPGPLSTKAQDDLDDVLSLIFATSMRISEVLAIVRDVVDFDAGTVTVAAKIEYVLGTGGYHIGPVKTRTTKRVIELPAFALEILARRFVGNDGLAFATRNGTPLSQNNVRRTLRRALAGHELGAWFTPHQARKAVASAVYAELGAAVAAAVLGHGDGGTLVLTTYGEKIPLAPNVTHITQRFIPPIRLAAGK